MLLCLIVVLLPSFVSSDCLDRSPYCNRNDCSVRPGYAREFCQKTCGNCTDFCENSKFVSCTESRKPECDAMLRDYCPVLCGACRPKKRTTTTPASVESPTKQEGHNSTLLVIPPPSSDSKFSRNMGSTHRTPSKILPLAVVSNKLDEVDDSVQPLYQTPIPPPVPVFLPELPQPEPIRPVFWAPHPTGYFPTTPSSVRRSPISSFYPLDHGSHFYPMSTAPLFSDRRLQALVTLLGCRDRDPGTCSKVTEETCLSRPGFYLKLCPVRCRNCDGLQCLDSIKVDCEAVRHAGGCRLAAAAEYCPRTCQMCPLPPSLADSVSICKDELDTCHHLAEGGLCESTDGDLLRLYCARSCGFCKQPQFYMQSPFVKQSKSKT